MLLINDYSPIARGDTLHPLAPIFVEKKTDGTIGPKDLTGLTISMKMQDIAGGAVKVCSATWVIDDALNGRTHRFYDASDVDTPGTWEVFIALANSSGRVVHGEKLTLDIEDVP